MKNIALLFALALLSGCATHSARYESGVEEVYWVRPPAVYGGYVVHEYYDTGYSIRHKNLRPAPPLPGNHAASIPAHRQGFDAHPVPHVPQMPRFSHDGQRGNSGVNIKDSHPSASHAAQPKSTPKPALQHVPTVGSELRQNLQNSQQTPARNDAGHKPDNRREVAKSVPSAAFGGASPKPDNQFVKPNAGNKVNDKPAFQAPRPSESGGSRTVGKPSSGNEGKFSKRH